MARKKNVVEQAETTALEEALDQAIPVEDVATLIEGVKGLPDPEPSRPALTDPSWHDYVMSLFKDDEVNPEGQPYVYGLWRVAEVVFGPIHTSISRCVQARSKTTPATAEHLIEVEVDGKNWAYQGVADVAEDNLKEDSRWLAPSAMAYAATRAKGRALRELLRLRKVICAEEAGPPKGSFQGLDSPDITETQISMIDNLCHRLNINVLALVKARKTPYDDINKIPYDEAQQICQGLDGWQKNPEKILDKVKGYDPDWRS